MRENKNQELYFATVIFILLTIHFDGNAIDYFSAAGEIEANWSKGRRPKATSQH